MNALHSFGTLNGQQVCPPVQLLGGHWRLSSSFPGYIQCLSNAACSLFDSLMWTKTVWICRSRGVRAFPWYHSLGPPVFLCSPAVFFPPSLRLCWADLLSFPASTLAHLQLFQEIHSPACTALKRPAHASTLGCLHQFALCSSQPVPPALSSLGSPVSVDLQLFQVVLQLTVSSLHTPMSLFCPNIPSELLLALFFKGGGGMWENLFILFITTL